MNQTQFCFPINLTWRQTCTHTHTHTGQNNRCTQLMTGFHSCRRDLTSGAFTIYITVHFNRIFLEPMVTIIFLNKSFAVSLFQVPYMTQKCRKAILKGSDSEVVFSCLKSALIVPAPKKSAVSSLNDCDHMALSAIPMK